MENKQTEEQEQLTFTGEIDEKVEGLHKRIGRVQLYGTTKRKYNTPDYKGTITINEKKYRIALWYTY